ncbi:hypothetical protein [Kitasatospora sp. MBT66]|uniref:hypothetical protein n=1 Tax=Kitasatospora sp. MBT66 TaxID=1444769 RepID=UPI0005B9FCFD|nr:hypothetical protein [Kitasatospora sp. MBT66]
MISNAVHALMALAAAVLIGIALGEAYWRLTTPARQRAELAAALREHSAGTCGCIAEADPDDCWHYLSVLDSHRR